MSVSRLHANTSSPDVYWRKRPNRRAHLELCHRNPHILERMLNRIALSNSTVGSASYKVTRIWENFNNRGAKMILLSDQLWSIVNNSKSFANESKSIIRTIWICINALVFTLFRTFKNIIMDLMVQKYRFDNERYIRWINDIWEWQKMTTEFGGKRSCLKRIRSYNTGEERGGSRHSC